LKFPDLKSLSLVDVVALLSLAVLVVTHLPAALESHQIRRQVAAALLPTTACALAAALPLAANAQAVVGSNALKGASFDATWVPLVLENQAAIEIAASTGIITLTFAEIDGGGKSLKLIPVIEADAGLLPLAQAGKASAAPSRKITWVCTSSLTRSRNPYIMANKGTLESKYAPDACRHRAFSADML
jgi:hypothetical protein